MKRFLILMALLTALPAGHGYAAVAGTQTDFSGWWVMDMHRTHDVPSHLRSYQLNVRQTGQQITINTSVEGDFRLERRRQGIPGGGGNFPGGRQRGGGSRGGGGGMSGLPRGGGFPGGRSAGGSGAGAAMGPSMEVMRAMALSMASPVAIYNLDGSPSTLQVEKPVEVSTTLKATWKKHGKQLDLSRVEIFSGKRKYLKVREQWKLSKDGQTLEVERTINTPRGFGKVKMIFNKAEGFGGKTRQNNPGNSEP